MTEAKNEQFDDPSRRARLKGSGKVLDRRLHKDQITSEKLLEQAKELHQRGVHQQQNFSMMKNMLANSSSPSKEVLEDQRAYKRVLFERRLLKQHHDLSLWICYAQWEEEQQCLDKARSVFERCQQFAEFVHRSELWRAYAAMEQRAGQLTAALYVLERAVSAIPSADQLVWMDYVLLLCVVHRLEEARHVMNRWLTCAPPPASWEFCVQCALQYNLTEEARAILCRYPVAYNTLRTWLFYAQIECGLYHFKRATAVMKAATVALSQDETESLSFQRHWVYILQSAGRIDEAREVLDRALMLQRKRKDKESFDQLADVREAHELRFGPDATTHRDGLAASRRGVFYTLARRKLALVDVFNTPLDVLLQHIRDAIQRIHKGSMGDMKSLNKLFKFDQKEEEEEEKSSTVLAQLIKEKANATDQNQMKFLANLALALSSFLEELKGDVHQASRLLQTAIELLPREYLEKDQLWIALAKMHMRHYSIKGARQAFITARVHSPTVALCTEWIQFEAKLVQNEQDPFLMEAADTFIDLFPKKAYEILPLVVRTTSSLPEQDALHLAERLLSRSLTDDRICCCHNLFTLTLLKWRFEQGNICGCLDVYKRMIQQKTSHLVSRKSSATVQQLTDLFDMFTSFVETITRDDPNKTSASSCLNDIFLECFQRLDIELISRDELEPLFNLYNTHSHGKEKRE